MKGLGEAFGADQKAKPAMAAAIFQLAVKLHVLVVAPACLNALRLPVFGFDQNRAAHPAPERIGARVAQHQINLFRRRVVVALADGEARGAGKERRQQLFQSFPLLARVAAT